MRHAIAILSIFLFGACSNRGPEAAVNASNDSEPVANEASVTLSKAELAALKQRADKGDLAAANALGNYYAVNAGLEHEDTIFWQLQAARLGDCAKWADLMFMEDHEGQPVPARFFKAGETLVSIGAASKCPPYKPRG
jgi:hypothetical protein